MNFVPTRWTRRLLLLVLFCPLPLEAQETSRGGFRLTTPLGLSYGRERKLPVGSRLIDDSVFVLAPPRVSLIGKSPRNDFRLDYAPDFELFRRHRDLNAWNHAASLHYTYKLTRRWTLEAGDSFLATEDASRQLEDSFLLLPRGRFQENSAYLGLAYALGRQTTLNLRLDNAVTKTRLPENPRSDFLDAMSSVGTLSVSKQLSRGQHLTAGYSIVNFRDLGKTEGEVRGSSRPSHSVNLAYTYTFDPNLFLRLSAGVIHGTLNSYSASAEFERRMRGLRVAAGYQRQLSVFGGIRPGGGGLEAAPGFATGLLPNSLSEMVTLKFRANVGNRMGIEGGGMGARTRSGNLPRDLKSLAGRLRLDLKVTERLVAFSTVAVYRQNLNAFMDASLERTRYLGGIDVLLSKPRTRDREETGGAP